MCDQIEAQIRADSSALNATSAVGKIGGLTGAVDVGILLKKEKMSIRVKVRSVGRHPHFLRKLDPVPVLAGLRLSFLFFIFTDNLVKFISRLATFSGSGVGA